MQHSGVRERVFDLKLVFQLRVNTLREFVETDGVGHGIRDHPVELALVLVPAHNRISVGAHRGWQEISRYG